MVLFTPLRTAAWCERNSSQLGKCGSPFGIGYDCKTQTGIASRVPWMFGWIRNFCLIATSWSSSSAILIQRSTGSFARKSAAMVSQFFRTPLSFCINFLLN